MKTSNFTFKIGNESIEFILTIPASSSSWNITTPAMNHGCVMSGWIEGNRIIHGMQGSAIQLFVDQMKKKAEKEIKKLLK